MAKAQSCLVFLFFCAVLGNIFTHAHGLYCVSCDDVHHARDCTEVVQCDANSVTKPTVQPHQLILCSATCTSDLCAVSLCGDVDFQQPRGPICFSCDQTHISDCSLITICGRDQTCFYSIQRSGCQSKQACQAISSMFGKKRDTMGTNCFKCCDSDLCNTHNCSSSGGSQGRSVDKFEVSQPCVDVTATDACSIAAHIVCGSRDKAQTAGCLNFCGYC